MARVQAYDAPNHTVHRELDAGVPVAAGANAYAHFQFFQKTRIRGIHAMVLVKGTDTTTVADTQIEVQLFGPGGTTSIANYNFSTNAALYELHSTVTATVAANNGVRFISGPDASQVIALNMEFEVLPDAAQS